MSLETYIGTKIVKGEPQDCQKDSHNSKVGDPGYKVVYEDDYTSWSPKDVFEKAYRKTDGMTFGLALEAMKKGLKVRLPEWGKTKHLYIKTSTSSGKVKFYVKTIIIHYTDGPQIWVPTLADILSDKWQIWKGE